ncbi:hypothetical protein SLEP1_g15921 [Rubroshorea leprosula]|uniref:RRM domain-containing protein n=1 Tax=Rubroshorea leprosula TaxID=152421 RepID=A0AAV5IP43_9ROSI|nr:hypothetical protein SLEP1_g15921 [Rubroshorea leprosula]
MLSVYKSNQTASETRSNLAGEGSSFWLQQEEALETMVDPYSRYASTVDRGSVSRPSFPGYLQSEAPSLASHFAASSSDTRAASGVLNEDMNSLRPGGYGLGSIPSGGVQPEPGLGVLSAAAGMRGYSSSQNTLQHGEYGLSGTPSAVSHPEPSFVGESAAASRRGYSPLEDDAAASRRGYSPLEDAAAAGINRVIPDITNEKPSSVKNFNGPSAADGQSNLLFVDGLPTDCTRREVGHIFRPFFGYKDIKVVHKEPRRSGDRATVFCFVEFVDSKCALTAMNALQGYKFDDKKPESPVLRIQFAHFPLRLGSYPEDQ